MLKIVGAAYFMDIFIGYSEKIYDFLMSFCAYTYACAGISYLSNLLLVIMSDMGKHRWQFTEAKLLTLRYWIHTCVGLLNCGILVYFLLTFFLDHDNHENDHVSVAVLYFFAAGLVCVVNIL
jgi:hypothetical protein